MTEGIIQKVFRQHERYFGQDYEIDQQRLQQELIEKIKQESQLIRPNNKDIWLNLLIGDNE